MGKRQDRIRRLPVVGASEEEWNRALDRNALPETPDDAVYIEPEYENHALPIAELHVDPSYQRVINRALLRRIVTEYDPLLMEPIDVNMRPDCTLWVMDGQHRVAALRELFGPTVLAECRVYFGLSLAQEARIFNMSDARKPQTPRERFRAGLISQQEPYTSIAGIVRKAGWHVADGQPGEITAVGALLQAYRQWPHEILGALLSVYADAFGYDTPPKSPSILGLGTFLHWYRGEYDRAHLVTALRKRGLVKFLDDVQTIMVKSRTSGKDAVLATLITAHNARMPQERRVMSIESAAIRARDRASELTRANLTPGLAPDKGQSVSGETVIERGALTVTQ